VMRLSTDITIASRERLRPVSDIFPSHLSLISKHRPAFFHKNKSLWYDLLKHIDIYLSLFIPVKLLREVVPWLLAI
jgi:hypothetical protein